MNISNSLIKDYDKYRIGTLCGGIFKALWIDRTISIESTEAMKKGIYFEYICTGTIPRSGEIPQPETTKAGKLTADYERLQIQKQNFENLYKDIKIVEKNLTIEHNFEGWNLKVVFDIFSENDTIRDIKTTSAIDNRWEEYGWENLSEKHTLLSQPLFYSFVYWKRYGIIPKFYFDVFAVNNERFRVFQVVIKEHDLIEFESKLKEKLILLENDIELGFEFYPEYKNCSECLLRNTCEMVSLIPKIETIYIS